MQWKQVKDELPPTGKSILIGRIQTDFIEFPPKEIFEWWDAIVTRPYDLEKMYNENYYTWKIAYLDESRELLLDYFWTEVKTPDFFVKENE